MENKKPLLFENIDFDKIQFSNIKTNNKKKVIYLKYNNDNFVIQTPTLNCIKGPNKLSDNLWNLEIPLEGEKEKKISEFILFLKKLDQFIIKLAKKNSKEWFNKLDNATYLNSIRDSSVDSYDKGFIKLKIIKSDNFKTLIKKNNKFKIDVEDIVKDKMLKSILQIYAIWIKPNNQFGIYFRPLVISIKDKININYDSKLSISEENIFIKKNEIDSKLSNMIMETSTYDQDTTESSSDEKINIKKFNEMKISDDSEEVIVKLNN